jgi:hypothetical protein
MKKIIFLFALILSTTIKAQICFSVDSSYNAFVGTGGLYPQTLITKDFNTDGITDIATANWGGSISIFLGMGNAVFGVPTNLFPGSNGYTSIISEDFNSDGFLDLAFADGQLSVSFGGINGSFGAKIWMSNTHGAKFVTSGDFNSDGKIDLAITNTSAFTVSILIGDGLGGFVFSNNFMPVVNEPSSIVSADFNNDGKMDLATSNVSSGSVTNHVNILLGDGAGNFGSTSTFPIGNTPRSIITADFNSDGNADLVTANQGPNNVAVLLGTGTGSFTTNTYATNWAPYSVVCSDFDGDGVLDLATSNYAGDDVSILKGTGTGSFAPKINFPNANMPYGIASGDFNNDGKSDLVTGNDNSHIWVMLNCSPCNVSVNYSMFQSAQPLYWNIIPNYSANIISAKWSWGDGTDTIAMYPSHMYAASGNYNICVTAYASCGDSVVYCQNDSIYKTNNSNTTVFVNVIPNTVTSVKELNLSNSQILFYPNPATNSLTITNILDKTIVRFYDAIGKIVLEKGIERNMTLDVSVLAEGVYTVITESVSSKTFNKIIITK